METIPTTSRSLDRFYHINGDTFEKQYKEILSGYREWPELSHAEDWLVFPENMGESICIDETAPSKGELYTIVSNRASRGGKGTIIAIVKGVAADTVTEALKRIDEEKRLMVKEVTLTGMPFHLKLECRTPSHMSRVWSTSVICSGAMPAKPMLPRCMR